MRGLVEFRLAFGLCMASPLEDLRLSARCKRSPVAGAGEWVVGVGERSSSPVAGSIGLRSLDVVGRELGGDVRRERSTLICEGRDASLRSAFFDLNMDVLVRA